jgi:hypothetical protein
VDFDDLFFSVLASIGFLAGHFAQDKCYIVSSEDEAFGAVKHLGYRTLRDTIKSQYKLLNESFHAFLNNNDANKYQNKQARILPENLESLATLCHDSPVFLNSIILFLETCILPREVLPVCLSVCMEGICRVILPEDSQSAKPIDSNDTAKKARGDLLKTLERYKGDISSDGFQF